MRRIRTRLWATLLSACLLLSLLPVQVLAGDEATASLTVDGVTMTPEEVRSGDGWSYDGNYHLTLDGYTGGWGIYFSPYDGMRSWLDVTVLGENRIDEISLNVVDSTADGPEYGYFAKVRLSGSGTLNLKGASLLGTGQTEKLVTVTEGSDITVALPDVGTAIGEYAQITIEKDAVLRIVEDNTGGSLAGNRFLIRGGTLDITQDSKESYWTENTESEGCLITDGGTLKVTRNSEQPAVLINAEMYAGLGLQATDGDGNLGYMCDINGAGNGYIGPSPDSSYGDCYSTVIFREAGACDHEWGEWTVTREATCTKAGSKTRTCSLCNVVETQTIPAPGHDYQAEVTTPTCTAPGYTSYACSRCHDRYVDNYMDALGHDWSPNDCTQEAACSRCDAVRPAGTHVWSDWTVTKEATCTEDGSKERTCTSCGTSEQGVVPALGHDWSGSGSTCSRCGAPAAPASSAQVTGVRFDERNLYWDWNASPDFTDANRLRLLFYRDGETEAIGTYHYDIRKSRDTATGNWGIRSSISLGALLTDNWNGELPEGIPAGHYSRIKFQVLGGESENDELSFYNWPCSLDITYDSAPGYPASVEFERLGAAGSDSERCNLTVTGLTPGQYIGVHFRGQANFRGAVWSDPAYAEVTGTTQEFPNWILDGLAFYEGNQPWYIVRSYESTLANSASLRLHITDLSGWRKGDAAAPPPITTAVYNVYFGSGPDYTVHWNTNQADSYAGMKWELSEDGGDTWVEFADTGIIGGSARLSDLMAGFDRTGHYNKVRLTPYDSHGQSGAPYEQPLELDLTYKADDAQPASAQYSMEKSDFYDVTLTGIPVGKPVYVYTRSDPEDTGSQVVSCVGTNRSTGSTMTFADNYLYGVTQEELFSACYNIRTYDFGGYSLLTLKAVSTDLSGWQKVDPQAHDHTWSAWQETPATCTENGSKTRTCSQCHKVETVTIPALGHDYQAVVTQPTCTEGGYTTHTCSRCDDSYRDAETDALGHAWGEWVLTTPPTEEHAGVETRTCSRCNATETRDVAKLAQQDVRFPASSMTKTYGDAAAYNTAMNMTPGGGKLTYASSDPTVAVVDAVSGEITIKGAGTATITATAAAVPGKYAETSVSFTFTVNKAPLTVRADDAAIAYGQSTPAFTWTAKGFVYGEDERVLTGQAQFACAYKTYGSVGTYPITLSGLSAQNYDITFEAGALTVSSAEKYTITLGKLEQLAGHTSPVTAAISPYDATAQISVEYQVNGSWTSTVPTEAGSYAVRAALTASDNISFTPDSYTEGLLLVKNGVTVDTGNGDADVDVSVEVDSGKAEISVSEDDLNTILENANGSVSVDLGGVSNVDELVLPGDLVSELSKNDKTDSFTVSTEDASITLSGPALDTVAGKITSGENKVSATLKSVNRSDLNEAQQEALKDIPEDAKMVDVSLVVTHPDGSRDTLHELGGDVTITVPYDELPGVIEGQYVVACHVSDNGVVTYLFAVCDPETRTITFTSTHFSHYAVFVSEKPAVIVADGSGSGLYEVGATVTITADSKSGYRFDHWEIVSGNVTLTDANRSETTFTMLAGNVEIAAVYTRISSGGGGSSTPTYAITVEPVQNGSVSVQPQKAAPGDTVTVTVQPDQGYKLGKLTVTDGNGKAISVTAADGKYTFVMPQSRVTVKADFVKHQLVFTDVPAAAYYAEAVEWAVSQGITAGTTATTFSPDSGCTRAQIVTFLWRAAGSPVVSDAMGFTDVPADAYYAEAVRWAVAQGITAGTSVSTFSPDSICTRGQIAAFLFRANGQPAATAAANPFSDVAADSYYYDAVLWAAENGITAGTSATTFSPNAPCTRAQIVTFLFRATGK